MASGGTEGTRDELRPESPGWWTGDRIVAAIRAWAERTGQPPKATEWRQPPSYPMNTRDGPPPSSRPSTRRVIRVFGSWSEAIEAAGFTPRGPGRPRMGQPSGSTRGRPPNEIEQAYALPIASPRARPTGRKGGRLPPLVDMDDYQRRELYQALLDADSFEDLPGKWQAAVLEAEQNRPKLRVVTSE
jgi:hypothetical protein